MIENIQKIIGTRLEDINIDFLNNRISLILCKRTYKNGYLGELLLYELALEDLYKIDYQGLVVNKTKIRTYIELKEIVIDRGERINLLERLYLTLLNRTGKYDKKILYEEEESDYYGVRIKLIDNIAEFKGMNPIVFEFKCKKVVIRLIKEVRPLEKFRKYMNS